MKQYKNGICNSYPDSSRVGKVYFAKVSMDGKELVKIGFYSGDYKIINNLNSRYKAKFMLLKIVSGTSSVEQELHAKFAAINHLITYLQSSKPCKSTEFFLATPVLIDFVNKF